MATKEDALDELIVAVRADDEYKKFRLLLKNIRGKLKIDADRNEAMGLLAARTSRTLYGKKQFSPKAMLEAVSNDMQARTRIVEIRVRAKIHVDTLEEACKAIKNHVITEYADQMRQFTNAETRTAFTERVQGTARNLLTEAQALIDMLDQIVIDVDKASFHMTNMTNMIVLLDGSKGSKVI